MCCTVMQMLSFLVYREGTQFTRAFQGLFGVSRLHTLFSLISGRICCFAFVAENWRNKMYPHWSEFVFGLHCSRVPKHLIQLVSLFYYTFSISSPLSPCSCFSASLFPPDLTASLHSFYHCHSIPRQTTSVLRHVSYLFKKEFGCHSNLGLRGEESLQI